MSLLRLFQWTERLLHFRFLYVHVVTPSWKGLLGCTLQRHPQSLQHCHVFIACVYSVCVCSYISDVFVYYEDVCISALWKSRLASAPILDGFVPYLLRQISSIEPRALWKSYLIKSLLFRSRPLRSCWNYRWASKLPRCVYMGAEDLDAHPYPYCMDHWAKSQIPQCHFKATVFCFHLVPSVTRKYSSTAEPHYFLCYVVSQE